MAKRSLHKYASCCSFAAGWLRICFQKFKAFILLIIGSYQQSLPLVNTLSVGNRLLLPKRQLGRHAARGRPRIVEVPQPHDPVTTGSSQVSVVRADSYRINDVD